MPFADTNLFKIPDGLNDEQVLFLTDILPTGYMGVDLAEVGPGDTVVVIGCGPVGVFAQLSALIRGAATEIITHRMSLNEGARGYEVFDNHEEDVLKVVMTP